MIVFIYMKLWRNLWQSVFHRRIIGFSVKKSTHVEHFNNEPKSSYQFMLKWVLWHKRHLNKIPFVFEPNQINEKLSQSKKMAWPCLEYNITMNSLVWYLVSIMLKTYALHSSVQLINICGWLTTQALEWLCSL